LHTTQRRFKLSASYLTNLSIHVRSAPALMKRLFDIISWSFLVILFAVPMALTALSAKLTSRSSWPSSLRRVRAPCFEASVLSHPGVAAKTGLWIVIVRL
jgi:lipopolysaccharide/colanic/teichoic acid biosynthesis glycosyltransferase